MNEFVSFDFFVTFFSENEFMNIDNESNFENEITTIVIFKFDKMHYLNALFFIFNIN